MRTLVISDLHLGRSTGEDILQRPVPQAALVARLAHVDRLVLLGDTVELRHGPAHEALDRARPALAAIGAAMAGRDIVVVPGNHDHELAADWHARRCREDAPPLSLEQRVVVAEGSWMAERLAAALGPAEVTLAYPGVWLREDVYALHGHHLDVHSTIPTFERLAAGLTARIAGEVPARADPDDYERVLAPNYAWSHAVAQRAHPRKTRAGADSGARVYRMLAGDGPRPVSHRLLARSFPVAVLALSRLGLGPLHADISPAGLRRAVLAAMEEVVGRLEIDAAHVVFGHSHRAGPLRDDDPTEWRQGATSLHNTGSWVYEGHFVDGGDSASPYWPGCAVAVDGVPGVPPRLERLLEGVPRAELLA